MDYQKIYNNLIESRKSRGLNKKKLIGYYEKHHIIPRCMGGKNKKENYVLLTYKEHILAHRILHLLYPDHKKLTTALFLMTTVEITENGEKIRVEKTTKEMIKLKEEFISMNCGKNHPMYGKHQSEESKRKNSESQKGEKSAWWGRHHTEESKKKISEAQKGEKSVHYGVPLSEEQRSKMKFFEKGHVPWHKGKKITGEMYDKMYGKRVLPKHHKTPMTEDHKKKLSDAQKGEKSVWWGRKHTPEELAKMSAAQKGRKHQPVSEEQKRLLQQNSRTRKPVQGPDGTIYISTKACATELGLTRSTLQKWIKEKPEKGFKFVEK